VNINIEKMTAEIDLRSNAMYIVKDGQLKKIDAPPSGFGEYTTIWKDGKVLDVIKSERVRI